MSKKFLLLIFLIYSCSTVEFIPTSDFKPEHKKYQKKNWEEVEIVFEKPQKGVDFFGSIVVRDFNGDLNSKNYQSTLKKELYKYKLDGVWIKPGKVVEVEPFLIQTQNADGLTLTYYKANKEMGKMIGIPYRYK